MCLCSGSCNCNSTTIPKGPAGPIGPQGEQGPAGKSGINGLPGEDGSNSFTTLTNLFYQPTNVNGLANSFVTIDVVDSTWAAINQIIYISYSATNIGGYYRVISKPSSTSLYITRLSWTIPGVAFVSPGGTVLNNSAVVPSATKGADGNPGTNGTNGINGVNAFTTVIAPYFQPGATAIAISVANNTWIGVNQIIYISSTTVPVGNIGGFYRVDGKTGTTGLTITRLDWVAPGVTFAAEGDPIAAGSIVSASGTKGVDGSGTGLSYIVDAQWGTSPTTFPFGVFQKITSIKVPAASLINDDDALECQCIFRINANTAPENEYVIKVSSDNTITGVNAVYTNYYPNGTGVEDYVYIHINYKIQRIGATSFKCKSEIFYSLDTTNYGPLLTIEAEKTFMCVSYSNISLPTGNWTANDQWIVVGALDGTTASSSISVIHNEVRLVKKFIP